MGRTTSSCAAAIERAWLAVALVLAVAGGGCAPSGSSDAWCYDVEGSYLKPSCDRSEDACVKRRARDHSELEQAAAQRGERMPRFSECRRSESYCMRYQGAEKPWCFSSNDRCLTARAFLVKTGGKSRECRQELPPE